ncbi:MAG: hypothetical protein ACRDKW_01535 [Actinomycetota bacterium]
MPNGDAAGTVLDPLKNELENQKLRAEVRKTDAEARKARNDLLTSHIPTELPQGKLEAPPQPSPIRVLAAYRALDAVAVTIAACVPPGAGQTWIVPDDRAAGHRALHALLRSQLDRFERSVADAEALLEGSPQERRLDIFGDTIGGMALPAALASIPAVLSLFKTDVTVRNRDVTIPARTGPAPRRRRRPLRARGARRHREEQWGRQGPRLRKVRHGLAGDRLVVEDVPGLSARSRGRGGWDVDPPGRAAYRGRLRRRP